MAPFIRFAVILAGIALLAQGLAVWRSLWYLTRSGNYRRNR